MYNSSDAPIVLVHEVLGFYFNYYTSFNVFDFALGQHACCTNCRITDDLEKQPQNIHGLYLS
jgi:hypothetical protein